MRAGATRPSPGARDRARHVAHHRRRPYWRAYREWRQEPAEITNDGGELAASGSAGLIDVHAVFDQILTQPPHRRLGLGTVVMNALTGRAVERGMRQGARIATPEGRALYQTLGWTQWSEITSVISQGTLDRGSASEHDHKPRVQTGAS